MLFLGTILFALLVVSIPILLTHIANAKYITDKEWKLLKEKFSKTNFPRENVHIIPKAKIGKKSLRYALKVGIDTEGLYLHVSKMFTALAIWFVPWSYIENLSINEEQTKIHFKVENIEFELQPINPAEFYEIAQENYKNRNL